MTSVPHTLSPNARQVLEKRYLLKDSEGQVIETPDDLFRRVAMAIAEGDAAYGADKATIQQTADTFYRLMAEGLFLPNSPTLMNAGRPLGQLSACFVLPIEDSLESIFETLKHAALIHQSGGGTGFSFSQLRPQGDVVRSTMGVSSGPISFMEVFNAATEAIKQGGTRRGANMGILRIDHPDIEAFISCKADLSRITNFNISVTVTDEFMAALKTGSDFTLRHPETGDAVKTVSAQVLFDQLVTQAWQTGEPGVVFINRINNTQPTPTLGLIESTNPCGEVPLLPYEACNLGSINLGRLVTTDLNGKPQLDWDHLATITAHAIHFLDNVITQNRYPLPAIKAQVEGNRKIGLGVMGWADLLVQLGIAYNSDAAINLASHVMAWIDYHGKLASLQLAQIRGSFPNFCQSQYINPQWLIQRVTPHVYSQEAPTVSLTQWEELAHRIAKEGLRNATVTCLAPTGTISIIANASGGIEPIFSYAFQRQVLEGRILHEVHPGFEATAKTRGFYSEALIKTIAQQGTLAHCSEIPKDLRPIFISAHDVAPEWHIKMQAAFQAFCDNAVSKTINFPESASKADVAKAYQMAYDTGVIKGLTVYRNNCRAFQPMSLTQPSSEKSEAIQVNRAAVSGGYCENCD